MHQIARKDHEVGLQLIDFSDDALHSLLLGREVVALGYEAELRIGNLYKKRSALLRSECGGDKQRTHCNHRSING